MQNAPERRSKTGTSSPTTTESVRSDSLDVLERCIEKFWADNPGLKRNVLRDWYNGGRVSTETNMSGLRAVDAWLKQDPAPVLP
jgi:hypothetical protein